MLLPADSRVVLERALRSGATRRGADAARRRRHCWPDIDQDSARGEPAGDGDRKERKGTRRGWVEGIDLIETKSSSGFCSVAGRRYATVHAAAAVAAAKPWTSTQQPSRHSRHHYPLPPHPLRPALPTARARSCRRARRHYELQDHRSVCCTCSAHPSPIAG